MNAENFQRSAIAPEDLQRVIDPSHAKDADLLAVYQAYQQHLLDEGRFDMETLENALRGLALSARGWREVPASDLVRNRAFRCLRLHGLRTGDALQLAAALEWVDSAPGGASLVTLDDRLGDAARAEGFTVLPA